MENNSPKRRKSKDNPYTLRYDNKNDTYTVTFKNVNGFIENVDIKKEVYDLLNKFELEDLSEMNEYDRHTEHSEVYEETLNKRMLYKPLSTEEIIEKNITNIKLKSAINGLSKTQRRRIVMYYFEDFTQEEIAKIENISHQAVSKNILNAIKIIKKNLKK
jgi:RNA polymerase sigma-70 factor (ECF subfamily)